MNSWQPNAASLLENQATLADHLSASILAKIGFQSSSKTLMAARSLDEVQAQLGFGVRGMAHPLVFAFNFGLSHGGEQVSFEQLSQSTIPGVVRSADRSAKIHESWGLSIDFNNPALNTPRITKRISETASKANPAEGAIELLDEDSTSNLQIFADALNMLREVWPGIAAEIEQSVGCVSFFRGACAIGAADICINGALLFNENKIGNDTVKLAEEIVHEASHVRLNTFLATKNFILNPWDKLYRSPLRQDERPMFGIVHQVFVLARLREFYLRCTQVIDSRYAKDVDATQSLLEDGFRVVQTHGSFTESGSRLMDSIHADLLQT